MTEFFADYPVAQIASSVIAAFVGLICMLMSLEEDDYDDRQVWGFAWGLMAVAVSCFGCLFGPAVAFVVACIQALAWGIIFIMCVTPATTTTSSTPSDPPGFIAVMVCTLLLMVLLTVSNVATAVAIAQTYQLI